MQCFLLQANVSVLGTPGGRLEQGNQLEARQRNGMGLAISYDSAVDKDEGKDNVEDSNGPQLVCGAPRDDTPIAARSKAVFVFVVAVGLINSLFLEDIFVCECSIFNNDGVEHRTKNVCFGSGNSHCYTG